MWLFVLKVFPNKKYQLWLYVQWLSVLWLFVLKLFVLWLCVLWFSVRLPSTCTSILSQAAVYQNRLVALIGYHAHLIILRGKKNIKISRIYSADKISNMKHLNFTGVKTKKIRKLLVPRANQKQQFYPLGCLPCFFPRHCNVP